MVATKRGKYRLAVFTFCHICGKLQRGRADKLYCSKRCAIRAYRAKVSRDSA